MADGVPMYDAVRLRACAACVAYDKARVTAENRAAVAQKVQTLLIDDLDGIAAEGTVRFGLDGTEYEIDLNAGHAQHCGTHWRPTCGLGGGSAVALAGLLAAGAGERRAG